MKNSQKGFIVPILITIIAVLIIGGGVYIYQQKIQQPKTNNQIISTSTNQVSTQQNIQATSPVKTITSSNNNNYLIKENIAGLKYIKSETKTSSCLLTLFSNSCESYVATYQGDVGGEFAVFVEIPNKPIMSVDEFSKEAKREFFSPGDWLEQFYFMKVSGTDAKILWISKDKFIGIKTTNLTPKNGDYIEELLNKYLSKYPSDLKLNNL